MTTAELLQAVIAQGVELRVSSGGELQVRDPEHRLSAELRAQLLERKPEVLAALDPAEAKRRKDHERSNHHARPVPWWQTPSGNWECGICHPDPGKRPAERDASYVVAAPNGAKATPDDDAVPLDPELLLRLDRLWTNDRDLERRSGVHRETIRAWHSGERKHGQRSKQEQLRAALHAIAEEQRERYERLYRPPTLTEHLARKYAKPAATELLDEEAEAEDLEKRPAQTAATAIPPPEPAETPPAPTEQPGAAMQGAEAVPAPVSPETTVLNALEGPAAEADWSQAACELASELASAHAREWLGEVRGHQFCAWLWSVLREGATIPYQEGRLSFAYAPGYRYLREEDERQWGGAVRQLLDLVAQQMGLTT